VIFERSASLDNTDIFSVLDGASLTLYNVILRNGGGPSRNSGGGIVSHGDLHVFNSVFAGNYALLSGRAIFNNDWVDSNGVQNGSGTIELIERWS
jgi:hypothetical protein